MQANKKSFERFYDEFRTMELNKEYYARRMSTVRSRLRALNIFLALFAAGSGVASFSLWNVNVYGLPVGPVALGTFTATALILSIARPYMGLEADLERLSSIQGVYSALASVHKDLTDAIVSHREISGDEEKSFDIMRKLRISMDAKEDKPARTKLVGEMQKLINERYPKSYFWYPELDVSSMSNRGSQKEDTTEGGL